MIQTNLTDTIAIRQETTGLSPVDLDETIQALRKALRTRSGRSWSITKCSGTSYGWIKITAPPARQIAGCMTSQDKQLLSILLDLDEPVHDQGFLIRPDMRADFVARAEGRKPKHNFLYT